MFFSFWLLSVLACDKRWNGIYYMVSKASPVVEFFPHNASNKETIMAEKLDGIDVFVQAVEAGSFSLAATRLHLTRSAVAKIIARLEQRLGTRLFHRTTRSQSLTEDGQAYYEHCLRALAELDAGEAALDSGRREPAGRLKVSAPVLFGRHCAAPLLIELTKRYPRLDVDISFSDRVVDLVDEGFDLTIRIGPLQDSTTLQSRRIGVQRMAVCASPAYLATQGRPASIDDIASHAGVVYGRGGVRKSWVLRGKDGKPQQVLPQSRITLDDLQAIADAAAAGHGLAWLPCWLATPYVQSKRLELVVDCTHMMAAEIYAVWPQTRYLPAKTRVAIDMLAAEIPLLMEDPAHFHAVAAREEEAAAMAETA
jgi:DNA-binding transcriptional LysR family regulator